MSSVPRVCSACGAASAWDARFCQQCGRTLDGPAPRYYRVLSPGPAFVLACVLVGAAVVVLIAGSLIAAIVLLAIAVIAFVFFHEAARRNPDDKVARSVLSSGHRLRGWARFALVSIAAWGRAARDVVRLRRESRSFRREEALAAARRHVDEERGAARATQQFAVDDIATREESEDE